MGIGRSRPFRTKIVITNQEQRLSEIARHNGFKLMLFDDSMNETMKNWLKSQ
jgi:hypothetical protein